MSQAGRYRIEATPYRQQPLPQALPQPWIMAPPSGEAGTTYLFSHIDEMYRLPFGYTAAQSEPALPVSQAVPEQASSAAPRGAAFASEARKGRYLDAWG